MSDKAASPPPTEKAPTPAVKSPSPAPESSTAAAPATESAETPADATPVPAVLPADHWAQFQGDDEDDADADSTLGNDIESSTASISSSILRYRTLHGRTYHSERGDAQYWGANDDRHNNSLDMLHHVFTLCLGDKLYLAPIEDIDLKKVVDIGTGTGLWAIDFADAHPETKVVGTDISPIQPTWVPPNISFEIEDFTQDWTFQDNSINFVHARYLVGSVPNWDHMAVQAFRSLAPGGYFESYEASPNVQSDDNTLAPDSATAQWGPLFYEGGKKIGHTFRVVEDNLQVKAMEAAGFVDIQTFDIKCPFGNWPADPAQRAIGEIGEIATMSDLEGFILFMTNVLGWSREDVIMYQMQLRKEVKKRTAHIYYRQKVVWGRKPEPTAA